MTHYHKYSRISETKDGVVEICEECKHRLVTKKDKNGRIDNETYRKEHIGDFAQPGGSTDHIFKAVYGKPKT